MLLMPQPIHYIPIITTVFSTLFAVRLYRHWRRKPQATYLLWWFLGLVTYAAGTLTESLTTLFGWSEPVFRMWYITGALLGGAPLAQGTVYLLLTKRTADRLSTALLSVVAFGAVAVLLSPINYALVDPTRLSGKVLAWHWVRLISPWINLYAVVFLVGGALWSAWKYYRDRGQATRMWGNLAIAVGTILPGIGGSFTRFGHVEVLYVTELVGVLFVWIGYTVMSGDGGRSAHATQRAVATV
ncbi:MAG: putative rane protein [Gemmatimonadetes bacterium]|nr:putative rane protein [Gemmatimonadota bacterium]